MISLRLARRTWIQLGILAALAAGLYPPWRYDVAGNPPRGVDVLECETLHAYATAWAPPAVPPRWMTQSRACSDATIDVARLGLTLGGIAVLTALLATVLSRARGDRLPTVH